MSVATLPLNATVILEGITGSRAYGLDTPESDTDLKGIFIIPTLDVLRIRQADETVDRHDPDVVYHEVAKFMRLAAAANPTILELLFLDAYTVRTPFGQFLIDHREKFLSKRVFNSYGGYAIQQVRRLQNRAANGDTSFSSDTKNRYAKHARHCFRLLLQGRQILESGTLTVRVTPEQREFLFSLGDLPVDELVSFFEAERAKFDESKSDLPDAPDMDFIEDILLEFRVASFRHEVADKNPR